MYVSFILSPVYFRTSMVHLGSTFLLYFSWLLWSRPLPSSGCHHYHQSMHFCRRASVHVQLLPKPFLEPLTHWALLCETCPAVVVRIAQFPFITLSHFAYYFLGASQHVALSVEYCGLLKRGVLFQLVTILGLKLSITIGRRDRYALWHSAS